MTATSFDLSAIKSDVLSSAANFRQLIGLGTSDTPTFKAATLSAGTLNGTVLDIAQTWGGTGTYTGLKYNVTDSGPSNAASLLMDLQVGGSSLVSVTKDGQLRLPVGSVSTPSIRLGSNEGIFSKDGSIVLQPNANTFGTYAFNQYWVALQPSIYIAWCSSFGNATGPTDLQLHRDAAGTLALRNDTSAQALRIYKTYSGGGTNFERWSISGANILFEKGGSGQDQDISIGNTTAFSTAIRGEAIHFRKANNSTTWWSISTAGHFIAGTDNTYDIGASGATRPRRVYIGGGSLTGSQADSSIEISPTWNTTGTPTAIKLNVTDTASNAASLLMDLQVGGSSRFSVGKAGNITLALTPTSLTSGMLVIQNDVTGNLRPGIYSTGNGISLATYGNGAPNTNNASIVTNFIYSAEGLIVGRNTTGGSFGISNGIGFAESSTGTVDTFIGREAANTFIQRNGTSAQTYRIYNTYTDASNWERAKIAWSSNVLQIGTEKLGTGAARALELQTDGTTALSIATNQNATFSSSLYIGASRYLGFNGRSLFSSPSDGVICLNTNAGEGGNFNRLQFGGTTSSFPAIKRNSAAINFRLADDSADCDITAKAATFSGNVTVSAVNLVTDTTTGTKIGTGTTQKLGFFNSTPVVQPAAVADATDAASVITQLNLLLARMRDLGLIAT